MMMSLRHRITVESPNVEERSLSILHIEDCEDDAYLVQHSLIEAGYALDATQVCSEPALQAELATRSWDIVLADFSMPQFDALRALELVKQHAADEVPFIIVSGAIGGESAVALMRAGAHDYVHKDKLERLAPAVERELRAAAERRQSAAMERRLLHTERLAAIGKLAAGVAHEINNPLAFMLGNMEIMGEHIQEIRDLVTVCKRAIRDPKQAARILREFLGSDNLEHVLADLDDIQVSNLSGIERIAAIVRDLRTFSHIEHNDIELVDINQLAATACQMVAHTVRYRARLVRDFESTALFAGDSGKLTQVLVNLLVNATHAVNSGSVDENVITVATSSDEEEISISISDTGHGIPPELLEHIFDPFFTTKSRGEGTGLGLSLCADIVRKHRGQIAVESTVGLGTRFVLRIPVMTGLESNVEPVAEVILPTPTTRSARLLFIDDEPEILNTYRRALDKQHEVVVASSAEQALERIAYDDNFDIVFCDVVLPGMNGNEFYEELCSHWPQLAQKTLFVTGGALSDGMHDFLDSLGERALQKPISPQQLTQIIACRSHWVALPMTPTRTFHQNDSIPATH